MMSRADFKFSGDDSENKVMMGNFPLVRQSSIYSLTFEELQNSLGGPTINFGSMNMDEFLKNIWTVEEAQAMTLAFDSSQAEPSAMALPRQGSWTLPRTLSQKTVDEVWRDMFNQNNGNERVNDVSGMNLSQKQQTLDEITLEEFLVRAGVVGEEAQASVRPKNSDFYEETSNLSNSNGLALGYSQTSLNNGSRGNGIMGNNPNIIPSRLINSDVTFNEVKQQQQQQHRRLFPKKTTRDVGSTTKLENNSELSNPIMHNPGLNNEDLSGNSVLEQSIGRMAMTSLRDTVVNAVTTNTYPANHVPTDDFRKCYTRTTASLSPAPYAFTKSLRGKKCNGTIEKMVERRQKRMIKNRESAARSRARKQAYTMELEAEVAKLKAENQNLQKIQEEVMEMQNLQILELINQQQTPKKQCLRRTYTGPW